MSDNYKKLQQQNCGITEDDQQKAIYEAMLMEKPEAERVKI